VGVSFQRYGLSPVDAAIGFIATVGLHLASLPLEFAGVLDHSKIAVLKKYAKVLTAAQCRQLNKIIVASVGASVVGAAKSAGSPVKGRSLGRVAPKYRLPTGETWTGRGLQPKVFGAWANSAEGKAWRAANQGEKYPSADKANPVLKTGTAVPKKARKVRTKTSAVKTPAKKRARKVARSSGRKGG